MDKFTHLHLHTDASLLDGLGNVQSLMMQTKSIGQSAIAMTDHGTLANSIIFSLEAQNVGIKPIMGLEGYIVIDGSIGHITLLADGQLGWESLVSLNNIAQASIHKRPAFDLSDLLNNSAGLVCLTGCLSSPLQRLPLKDAIHLGAKLKSVFGNRLFAEIMVLDDSQSWERSIKLSEKLNIKPCITNDVHFYEKGLSAVHKILTNMKGGFEYDSDELWLKTRQDLYDSAIERGLPKDLVIDALTRSYNIGQKVGYVNLRSSPKLPKIFDKSASLSDLVKSTDYYKNGNDEVRSRLNGELKTISKTGYEDYFVILTDLVNAAKRQNIKVGPGRGSGAGSAVLYALGITGIDPIEHKLSFDRFLNVSRVGMPDVDLDFDSEKRYKLLDYAKEAYGAMPIATYARYSHKSLVRDLGKQFKLDKKLIDNMAEKGENSKEFQKVTSEHPRFELAYQTMINQIRHRGKHAGGIIITDQIIPKERVSGDLISAWSEGGKEELSYAGIVKFDLLGLSVLTALANLEEKHKVRPDYPEDDSPVFEIFQKGQLSGIFQFSGSDGIRKLTMDLCPTKFLDLVAINALYRPGTLDAGVTDHFLNWKKSPRKLPEVFKSVLSETYGAIVFQEQMMEIYRLAVSGTMAEADNARRYISTFHKHTDDPKYKRGIENLKESFVSGMIDNHKMSKSDALKWWGEIETHSRYSFNRAHATSYSMIAWECAWWKYHFPTSFFSEMLNIDPSKQQQYVYEAIKDGVSVVLPHINISTDKWTEKDGHLYAPLSAIKQVGPNAVNAIIKEREKNGDFKSVNDFIDRVPKKSIRSNVKLNLAVCGSFAGLSDGETELIHVLSINYEKYKTTKQTDLLGFILPNVKLIEKIEHFAVDYDICGIVFSESKRQSKYGRYTVYRVVPDGSFWVRDAEGSFSIGDVLAVSKTKTGRAQKVKLL